MVENEKFQMDLERGIIGFLLSPENKKHLYSIIDTLEPRYFYFPRHKIIYIAIVDTFIQHNTVDLVLISSHLKDTGNLHKAGGSVYLSELMIDEIDPSGLYGRIDKLIDAYKHRTLKDQYTKLMNAYEKGDIDGADELITQFSETVYQLQYRKNTEITNVRQVAESILHKAANLQEGQVAGYSWGLKKLDFYTGGLEPGKTYVIGGTKKSGKSKFIINTIYHLKRAGIKSLFLSLEMDSEGVTKELLSRFGDIDNYAFKRGIDEMCHQRLQEIIKRIESDIYIDTSTFLSVTQIRSKIQSWQRRDVKVVFLDYLQRMNFANVKGLTLNWATIIGRTVAELADIAKENNVALVLLSQLRNEVEGQIAGIEHLRDSGGIADNVDVIMILNNQDRIQKNFENKTNEVWIDVEQRSGQSARVKCQVDLARASYHEMN